MHEKALITSGYPRSGNTYLNQALQLLYYPAQSKVNSNRHSVIAIEKHQKILVPFRNPLDAIASWHKYPQNSTLQEDVKFFIRFHKAVLDNLHKIVLMDFDYFTKDLNYIIENVRNAFEFEPIAETTDEQVKTTMLANAKEINLPRNNQEELNVVKNMLQEMPKFDECLELYATIKTIHN